jgi:hypothetical protein
MEMDPSTNRRDPADGLAADTPSVDPWPRLPHMATTPTWGGIMDSSAYGAVQDAGA